MGQVELVQRQSSRAGGLGSVPDLFLPTLIKGSAAPGVWSVWAAGADE